MAAADSCAGSGLLRPSAAAVSARRRDPKTGKYEIRQLCEQARCAEAVILLCEWRPRRSGCIVAQSLLFGLPSYYLSPPLALRLFEAFNKELPFHSSIPALPLTLRSQLCLGFPNRRQNVLS